MQTEKCIYDQLGLFPTEKNHLEKKKVHIGRIGYKNRIRTTHCPSLPSK